MPHRPEYVASVSLLISGRSFDPVAISQALKLRPTQQWRRGELKRSGKITFETKRLDSGWKRLLPRTIRDAPIERQLRKWVRTLRDRKRILHQFVAEGHHCRLVWFATADATVSVVVPSSLQAELAALGLDWEISMFKSQAGLPGSPETIALADRVPSRVSS